MSDQNSTTYWLGQLKAGNPQAKHELCERCWHLVVNQGREVLQKRPSASDAEDVAISVFATFFRQPVNERYPNLADGNELRKLFLEITRKKALEDMRNEFRKKRGGGAVKSSATEDLPGAATDDPALEAAWNDKRQWLLKKLDSGLLEVALLRLEGFEVKEIADRLTMPLRTVERKLQLIRECWNNLGASHDSEQGQMD